MTLPLIQVYAYRDIGVTSSSGGGTSSAFNHGSVRTVVSTAASGSFPTKATAAPVIFDNCSGTVVTDLWGGGWPSASGPPYDMAYSASTNGIAPAHSHVTRYLRGCANPGGSSNNGQATMVWTPGVTVSLPQKFYQSWYERADPAWNNLGGDGNFKTSDYSVGTTPYDAGNWYTESHPFTNSGSSEQQSWNDDGLAMSNPDDNGNNFFGSVAPDRAASFLKTELEMNINTVQGWFNWFIEGVINSKSPASGHSYLGPLDGAGFYSGTTRNFGYGGYQRAQGSTTNFRYFNDLVFDTTLVRLLLTNSPTFSTSTILEYQPATIWTSSSITFTVNLGKFSSSQTAYLWVIGSSGATGSPAPSLASTYTTGT